jgi:sigma-70-like protein
LAEDLSIALLLTLDRLSPLERAAFLLHDVFDFSFSEVAPALERSEAACRQLAARARAHVRAARFLVGATRKRAGEWWREDFTVRFATINGLLGVIVDRPEGPVQTAAFEIEGDVIRALYVVRNSDKLRHLAAARHESGRG